MSAIGSFFDVLPVKRSSVVNAVVSAFLRTPDHDDDDAGLPAGADESEEVNWWQHYGFVSRPPEGTEALVLRLGKQTFALASRLVRQWVYGQLKEGDVALYSAGENLVKLSADGSISLLRKGKDGGMSLISLSKDDKITMLIANGPCIQMSKADGIVLNGGQAGVTIASAKSVTINAPSMVDNVGSHKLHMAAVAPLISGPSTPVPNVFV